MYIKMFIFLWGALMLQVVIMAHSTSGVCSPLYCRHRCTDEWQEVTMYANGNAPLWIMGHVVDDYRTMTAEMGAVQYIIHIHTYIYINDSIYSGINAMPSLADSAAATTKGTRRCSALILMKLARSCIILSARAYT